MMYQNRLVVAIKVNDKVLREDGDTVFIPFGSEYSLYVKNMNSVRALVRVTIDGKKVTGNHSLIVPARGDISLERFMDNGDMSRGLRLKFIERTAKIENGPRGIQAEDGLISVEFEFEREPAKIIASPVYYPTIVPQPYYGKVEHHHHYHDSLYRGNKLKGTAGSPDFLMSANSISSPTATEAKLTSTAFPGEITFSCAASGSGVNAFNTSTMDSASVSASAASVSDTMGEWSKSSETRGTLRSASGTRGSDHQLRTKKTSLKREYAEAPSLNDKGITVGGSVSNQSFEQGAWFPTDGQVHVLVLKLLGKVGEKAVQAPVTVKTKTVCPTCGTQNKFGTKFCRECGTGLEKV